MQHWRGRHKLGIPSLDQWLAAHVCYNNNATTYLNLCQSQLVAQQIVQPHDLVNFCVHVQQYIGIMDKTEPVSRTPVRQELRLTPIEPITANRLTQIAAEVRPQHSDTLVTY